MSIYTQVAAERNRAHRLHLNTSMESMPVTAEHRLTIITEELGEVAKEFNDAQCESREVDAVKLRTELVQVAAMATAWADSIEKTRRHNGDTIPWETSSGDKCDGCNMTGEKCPGHLAHCVQDEHCISTEASCNAEWNIMDHPGRCCSCASLLFHLPRS